MASTGRHPWGSAKMTPREFLLRQKLQAEQARNTSSGRPRVSATSSDPEYEATRFRPTKKQLSEIGPAKTAEAPEAESKFRWNRSGGYEVSSKGDKRFSALYAKMPDGRTIEEHYQCDVKGYDPGGRNWKLGKGKPPLTNYTQEELYQEYASLWQTWASNNPDLVKELAEKAAAHGNQLTDRFAKTSINQARALSDILNENPIPTEQRPPKLGEAKDVLERRVLGDVEKKLEGMGLGEQQILMEVNNRLRNHHVSLYRDLVKKFPGAEGRIDLTNPQALEAFQKIKDSRDPKIAEIYQDLVGRRRKLMPDLIADQVKDLLTRSPGAYDQSMIDKEIDRLQNLAEQNAKKGFGLPNESFERLSQLSENEQRAVGDLKDFAWESRQRAQGTQAGRRLAKHEEARNLENELDRKFREMRGIEPGKRMSNEDFQKFREFRNAQTEGGKKLSGMIFSDAAFENAQMSHEYEDLLKKITFGEELSPKDTKEIINRFGPDFLQGSRMTPANVEKMAQTAYGRLSKSLRSVVVKGETGPDLAAHTEKILATLEELSRTSDGQKVAEELVKADPLAKQALGNRFRYGLSQVSEANTPQAKAAIRHFNDSLSELQKGNLTKAMLHYKVGGMITSGDTPQDMIEGYERQINKVGEGRSRFAKGETELLGELERRETGEGVEADIKKGFEEGRYGFEGKDQIEREAILAEEQTKRAQQGVRKVIKSSEGDLRELLEAAHIGQDPEAQQKLEQYVEDKLNKIADEARRGKSLTVGHQEEIKKLHSLLNPENLVSDVSPLLTMQHPNVYKKTLEHQVVEQTRARLNKEGVDPSKWDAEIEAALDEAAPNIRQAVDKHRAVHISYGGGPETPGLAETFMGPMIKSEAKAPQRETPEISSFLAERRGQIDLENHLNSYDIHQKFVVKKGQSVSAGWFKDGKKLTKAQLQEAMDLPRIPAEELAKRYRDARAQELMGNLQQKRQALAAAEEAKTAEQVSPILQSLSGKKATSLLPSLSSAESVASEGRVVESIAPILKRLASGLFRFRI